MTNQETNQATKVWNELLDLSTEGVINEDRACDLFADYLYERGYDYNDYCLSVDGVEV